MQNPIRFSVSRKNSLVLSHTDQSLNWKQRLFCVVFSHFDLSILVSLRENLILRLWAKTHRSAYVSMYFDQHLYFSLLS